MRELGTAALPLLLAASAAQAGEPTSAPVPVLDRIVVHKAARTLEMIADGQVVATLRHIQLGENPVGPKRFQGDGRTPEGHYRVDFGNGASAYRLALHISYPSPEDREFAGARGRNPGGAIFIHGQPNDWTAPGRVPGDWTEGCIALSDEEIESLWRATPDGTPIDIYP